MWYNTNTTHTGDGIIKSDTWTARIPDYVKEYFQKRGISAGRLIFEKYEEYNEKELPELLKEINRLENLVLQKRELVTQINNECNTEWEKCNTIFEQLSKNDNFSLNDITSRLEFRIKSRLEREGIKNITVTQFIKHFQEANNL